VHVSEPLGHVLALAVLVSAQNNVHFYIYVYVYIYIYIYMYVYYTDVYVCFLSSQCSFGTVSVSR